jgi:hypothetical protein
MSNKDGRDYLYLIWKSEKERKQFIVGVLSRNGQYEFKYYDDIKDAKNEGFKPLVEFPDLNKLYTSESLFSTFASRLPDKRRRDMSKILKKYELKEFNQYELLKKSGARLPIDNYEFINPVFDYDVPFGRTFYLAGARYYLCCDGSDCSKSVNIDVDEELYLKKELENKHDPYAVAVYIKTQSLIGYVPRYYSEGLFELLQKNEKEIHCYVKLVNKNNNCSECLKLYLEVE